MKKKDKHTKHSDSIISGQEKASKQSDIHYNEFTLSSIYKEGTHTEIYSTVIYHIRDGYGRTLCTYKSPESDRLYTCFAKAEVYPYDVVNAKFSDNPESTPANLLKTQMNNKDTMLLYPNSCSEKRTSLYFSKDDIEIDNQNPITLKAKYIQTSDKGDQYHLIWNNDGTNMYWYCEHTSDRDHLYVDAFNSSFFTIQPFYVDSDFITSTLLKYWSNINEVSSYADKYYSPITHEFAKKLYQNAKLGSYERRVESFNYEDFCHVYKAQVSKTAYENDVEIAYCFILMWGKQQNDKNAVIAFLDNNLNLKLMDARSGEIMNPTEWKNNPDIIII